MLLKSVEITKRRWAQNRRKKSFRTHCFATPFLKNAAMFRPDAEFSGGLGKTLHEKWKKVSDRTVRVCRNMLFSKEAEERMQVHPALRIHCHRRNWLRAV